jgi:TonB family protein
VRSQKLPKPLTLLSTLFVVSSVMALASGPASEPTDGTRVVLNRIPPQYPELARRMHISGIVVLRVLVQPNGTVAETHIQSGHALLGQAATQAVSQWRFVAAPESTYININVQFTPQ